MKKFTLVAALLLGTLGSMGCDPLELLEEDVYEEAPSVPQDFKKTKTCSESITCNSGDYLNEEKCQCEALVAGEKRPEKVTEEDYEPSKN